MKLSICIPVYNFDIRPLVEDLSGQIRDNGISAEIILIDDASSAEYRKINSEAEDKVENFVLLDKNVGRSLIRNLFLYYAKGDYLLFLDCDGKIISKDFLLNYKKFLAGFPDTSVIYGGRIVDMNAPGPQKYLRWKFACERENIPLEKRKTLPYLSFQTNNFIVRRSVLERVNFNPEFQKYGYEDLLFAMDLKAANIPIDHIENPVFNADLEDNAEYLLKVEESVESLAKMIKNPKTRQKISEIKLVKAYNAMNASTIFVFKKLFALRRRKIKEKLLQGNVNLRYLDFYKLGLLLEQIEN